jgi:hypothetical protein
MTFFFVWNGNSFTRRVKRWNEIDFLCQLVSDKAKGGVWAAPILIAGQIKIDVIRPLAPWNWACIDGDGHCRAELHLPRG